MNFGQRRWIYMASSMLLALCAGIGYTWSVFQKPLMENYGWALSTISLTFTIQIMVSTLAPVFIGRYQKIIGVKNYLRIGILIYVIGLVATMFTSSIGYLYLIYGVVVGIGISMLYPCLMSYSTSLFPEKTGMASGLLACSYGGGSILWAPLAAHFIGVIGVPGVFGVFAALFAVVMIPTSFLIKNISSEYSAVGTGKSELNIDKTPNNDYTWQEMLKTSRYYLIIIVLTIGATSGLMITGHASSMLQELQHLTPENAAILIGLLSIFNALGRLSFGLISDKLGRYNVMLLLFAVIGGSMILLGVTKGLIFNLAILAIGACYGGFTAMFSPICADNFGIKNLSVNYSFLYIAYGFAGLLGPQLAARTKAASGGYTGAFTAVAIMSAIGFILTLVLKLGLQKNQKKMELKLNYEKN